MSASSKIRWRRDLERFAKEAGWDCEYAKSGHYKLRKGPHMIVVASSPRNPSRSLSNTITIMNRYDRADASNVL